MERLLSQLAHVEILSPRPQESVEFFTQVLGLEETCRDGQSAYLRGWSEFFHHSLQITEGKAPGLGHIGWRAAGQEQLHSAVARLEASGQGLGWFENSVGHGPAYRYRAPYGGQLHEVFWEVERYQAPPELRSTFPNRPQRYLARGASVRYLDHVTIASRDIMADCLWYRDVLGHRLMEWTAPSEDSDDCIFAMLSVCERSHDLGIVPDPSSMSGRISHVAFWLDQREDVRRAADLLLELGVTIEFGPGRHGMGEIDYVYFREPGGMRIELNSGTIRNYEPDWKPVKWTPEKGSNVFFRNRDFSPTMSESFPPLPSQEKDAHIHK
ncbi:MAG TPA: VOC family protein [Candidatus Dormibacteraeota bacterium]|nr:VOC family protein [Candidatus Dormibacteraeota bacterium]